MAAVASSTNNNNTSSSTTSQRSSNVVISHPDNVAKDLLRRAISIHLQSNGWNGAQSSALEALVDLTTQYILKIGQQATSIANTGRRTQPSILDVISSFETTSSRFSITPNVLQSFISPSTSESSSSSLLSSESGSLQPPVLKRPRFNQNHNEFIPEFCPPIPPSHTLSTSTSTSQITTGSRAAVLESQRKVQLALSSVVNTTETKADTAVVFLYDTNTRAFKKRNSTSSIPSVPPPPPVSSSLERKDQNKEEMILAGTFYEGDSE